MRPELRAGELLAAIEALVPAIPLPSLLDLRDDLIRVEGAVLRRVIAPQMAEVAAKAPEDDPVFTLAEAAAYLRRSRSWLFHQWKRLHLGFRDGARVRFRRSRLDQYSAACERKSR
jgi:hypothetical protein